MSLKVKLNARKERRSEIFSGAASAFRVFFVNTRHTMLILAGREGTSVAAVACYDRKALRALLSNY